MSSIYIINIIKLFKVSTMVSSAQFVSRLTALACAHVASERQLSVAKFGACQSSHQLSMTSQNVRGGENRHAGAIFHVRTIA
jgi:hypothetical protein